MNSDALDNIRFMRYYEEEICKAFGLSEKDLRSGDVAKINDVRFGSKGTLCPTDDDVMNYSVYEAVAVDKKTLGIFLSCYLIARDEVEANQKTGVELYKQAQFEHEYSDDKDKEMVFDFSQYATVLRLVGKFQS